MSIARLKLGAHYPGVRPGRTGRTSGGRPGRPGVKRPVCTGRPGRTPEKACRAMLFLRLGRASGQCEQTTCSGLTMKRARTPGPCFRAGRPGSVHRALDCCGLNATGHYETIFKMSFSTGNLTSGPTFVLLCQKLLIMYCVGCKCTQII